ncbi:MAG: hypothetical protein HFE98_10610, partial [Ruminiclostridium sp.]|nr:hypothetical protein [Ruminiclostridium sp.]
MRRKFLASILALCMVMSLLPMTAFAADINTLTATVEAKETPTENTVTLAISTNDTIDEENGVFLYRIVTADTKPTAPTAETGAIVKEGLTQTIDNDTVTWTKYEPTKGTKNVEITATDGQYVLAVYVEPTANDNDKYDIKAGAVAGPVDDEYPTGVTSVTVEPTTLTLEVGKTGNLNATVEPEGSATVTWTTSNDQVATVKEGVVTAVGEGNAEITATAGGKSAKCTVTVQSKAVQKTTLTKEMFETIAAQTYTGAEIKPDVTPKEGDGNPTANDYTVSYSNNINAGTGKITVTANPTSEKFTGSVVLDFTINKATLTPTVALKANQTISKVYDGTNAVAAADLAKLDISFKVGETAKTLTQGTDYTVAAAYDDGNVGDSKTITVTLTLKNGSDAANNYTLSSSTGTVTGAITKKATTLSVETYVKVKPSDSDATSTNLTTANYVGLPTDTYTYALKDGETNGLTAAVDSNSGALTLTATATEATTTPVTVTIIATGTNNVVTITVEASLTAKNITTINATAATNLTYDGTAKNGYAAAPTADNVTGDNKFTFTYNTSDKTAPKDAGTYTVTITLNDETYVADPLVLEFTIAPASISSAEVILDATKTYTYTGEPIIPTITSVKVGEAVLVAGTDYTIENKANTNASESATVDVKGIGNYTDTKEVTFEIVAGAASVTPTSVSVKVGETATVTVNAGGTITLTPLTDEEAAIATATLDGNTITITGVKTGKITLTVSADAGGNYSALAATDITVDVTSGGGGGGSGSTTPTPPPVDPDPNPPSAGEDVTQTVTPDISEGTASATVDKETADKLVSDAVDNKSENVTVKVDVPADADVNEVKADIPASAVADLASKTDAALTVDTPVGNVTIPNKTLAQLGGTSGNVTVTAAVNEDNSVKVEVQANGSTVGALNGGMKVDLPVSQPTAGTVAVLVDAEGNETILPKSAVDGSEVAVLLENGSATIKFVDNAQSFADTDNHWAKNSIAFVSSRNLFQGMENSSFKADVPMNRAMLVTVLHRLESTPAASGGSFDDVPSDSYYATAAAWAAGKGIVTGDDSGFSGDRSVTREEMAV